MRNEQMFAESNARSVLFDRAGVINRRGLAGRNGVPHFRPGHLLDQKRAGTWCAWQRLAHRGTEPASRRNRDGLRALTAALLAGFELVLTYWLYTYIPWFYGFAAIALLAPLAVVAREPVPELDHVDPEQLDAARPAVV